VELETYKKVKSAVAALIGIVVAYGVLQNNISIAIAGVTIGMILLLITGRSIKEVTRDERSIIIQNKAASATLSVTIVGLAIVGLSMVFLGRQGIGNLEETGYFLAILANFILLLNAALNYYYRNKLGG